MTPMKSLKNKEKGLYAVTDERAGASLHAAVRAALRGGVVWVQYRNKTANSACRQQDATALNELCKEYGARFIVNDDVELAAALDAGVHLGRDDRAIASARARLGPTAWIGASCYDDLALAHHAILAGADYVAFGSFFPSSTKPQAVAADISLLTAAQREFTVPIVAIGGITSQNGGSLTTAGADLLAVITDLFGNDCLETIENAALAYKPLFHP